MPTDGEIAYAAGLFEGEGTVRVDRWYYANGNGKRPRKTPQVKLRIGMTDIEPLQRIQSIFGGRIQGPYRYKKGEKPAECYKPYWLWDLDSPPAVRAAIAGMWSFLSPRRQEQLRVSNSI